ncbi:UDP-N-acetylmuramoyl-tripeptide--D-alanyl-D-alanine ligase [Pacificibacter marinus]|uniref:UDP-N-acetylmuramoyl-tripeptide--D-alanyl-D-alanine ligase n=1 Tax=Pacificibacter marinus TaxID=658057 RepID=A0A1Y5SJI7_9RHOB|nr:UDP-N-acetylmuramoyl-tripeptide--D-alanyl-D-alanine ligase [Pacificibacter marinus]SEK62440.1 UDP-N-acetylmuramoyl-tripeptide--D-alanyl-D-alanine ligase [Pacificibacter marinus]SLN41072.1 UDP-N-acetylmuramoyl-tripeptide--D-alanyl-D-alanine ligase [Pacificibacter marinus]
MSALWTSIEAAQATGGVATCDFEISGVSIDTRTIQKGDLFVALKAERDGHDFVAQALAKGAAAALVSHVPKDVSADAPLLIVDDVLGGLERLGVAARARVTGKVIGVTGSVGKTSTKEMLRAILSGQGKVHAAEASYNNHWGVPLTLARMPQDTDFAILEIGMNHPGEIAPLAKMTCPDVAMITTVAAAHLVAFENIDGIAREKAAIFEGLAPDGIAVLNGDLAVTPILQAAWDGKTISFGETVGNDAQLTSVSLVDTVTVAEAQIDNTRHLFRLGTSGRHFATNAVGCLAVVHALDADVTLAARDLSLWAPPEGRGARETILLDPVEVDQTLELLDDAFNANPTSMRASLEVLAAAKVTYDVGRVRLGRRVAFLGDMLELGPTQVADHAALADVSWVAQIDVVHCVGPLMSALYTALPPQKRGRLFETAQDALPELHHLVDAGDVILVKGSKGSRVNQLVDGIRRLGHPLQE